MVRVLFDPFPVVVGAAEPETPGIALAVEALIIAGRVPGIGVEDGRPASGIDRRNVKVGTLIQMDMDTEFPAEQR